MPQEQTTNLPNNKNAELLWGTTFHIYKYVEHNWNMFGTYLEHVLQFGAENAQTNPKPHRNPVSS